MNWMVEFSPLLPLQALYILGGIGVLLSVLLLWTRTRGALLRIGALALLLLALANPSLRQEDREPLTNIAVVVMDKSASQRFADAPRKQPSSSINLGFFSLMMSSIR